MKKKWLWATLPLILMPTLVMLILASCGSRGGSGDDTAPRLAQARQASGVGPPRAACSPGSCMTIDEFDQMDASATWLDFCAVYGFCTTNCTSSSPCDITTSLQCAVDQIAPSSPVPTLDGGDGGDGGSACPSVGSGTQPQTIYIQPGNYTISQPIVVSNVYGGQILGANPDTTTIKWTGPAPLPGNYGLDSNPDAGNPPLSTAMFVLSSAGDFKVAGLTLDGNLSPPSSSDGGTGTGLAGIQVVQVWNQLSVYNDRLEDLVVKNLTFGIVTANWSTNFDDQPHSDIGNITQDVGTWYDFNVPDAVQSNTASSTIRRSSFENIFSTGVSVAGDNSITWLVEDNSFIDCHRGVMIGAGGFGPFVYVVNNLFFNDNGPSDAGPGDDSVSIFSTASAPEIYRGNVSVGASVFYAGGGVDQSEFSGNYVVINPATPHCFALRAENNRLLFLDNYVNSPDSDPDGGSCTYEKIGTCGTGVPQRAALGLTNATFTHGGNAYTGSSSSFWYFADNGSNWGIAEYCVNDAGTCASADSFNVADAGAGPALDAWNGWGQPTIGVTTAATALRPTIAPTGPVRTIFDASSVPGCITTTGQGCAQGINTALSSASGHYMLYFPSNHTYYLDGTINIPPSLDIVVAGDNAHAGTIIWVGKIADAAMFHAAAPSWAMFRDFVLSTNPGTTQPIGFLIDSKDDPGGLVYAETLQIGLVRTGLQMAGLDNVLVRSENFDLMAGGRSLDVIGGGAASQSSAATRGVFLLGGSMSSWSDRVSLRNWGKVVILGTDSEPQTAPQGMALNQSGYLTIENGRALTYPFDGYPSSYAFQPNLVVQSTFRGNVTYANMATFGGVLSVPAHQAQVLALQDQISWSGLVPYNESPGGDAGAQACNGTTWDGGGSCAPPENACNGGAPCLAGPELVEPSDGGATQMALGNLAGCSGGGLQPVPDVNPTGASTIAFTATMLSDLRNAPYAQPLCSASCSATNTQVRFHNVAVVSNGAAPAQLARAGVRVQRVQ